MAARTFPIRIGRRSRQFLRLWGVRSESAAVTLDQRVFARFGWFSIDTALTNVARWRIDGRYRWLTAIGVRRGLRGDVTFGGSTHGGVRLEFREPVRWGPLRVPVLYVTVDDLDGFAAALAARGIPGSDARGT